MKNNMLIKAIEQANSIAVAGHIRPDGDCVGSTMGLYLYVKKYYPEKEITVYLEEIPDTLHFMQETDKIVHEAHPDKVYDLFVALDCGDLGRLGFAKNMFERANKTLCVDHHISNQVFAMENHIRPDASSTSELVYNLLDKSKITCHIAECLYTGMVHDTGIFRYSCTHPSTMRAAADLMEKGINHTEIITKTFDEKTYAQNKILGYALMKSRLLMDGKCIVSFLTKQEMVEYQVSTKDLEGIVSLMKMTTGTDVSMFAYELEEGCFKFSLRSSENVDVSEVARCFGGGGHVRASGCTLEGPMEELIDKLIEKIALQLNDGGEV